MARQRKTLCLCLAGMWAEAEWTPNEVDEACQEVLEREHHSRPAFYAARVPPRMPMRLRLWTGVDGAGKPVLPERKCWCEYLTGQVCVHCQDKLDATKFVKA